MAFWEAFGRMLVVYTAIFQQHTVLFVKLTVFPGLFGGRI
jgi:hypothetical protein